LLDVVAVFAGVRQARTDEPRRTVYELLTDLEEQGRVRKKKPEPRRAIWVRAEETA
jgi:DNA-binding IclR family transcriptional regulator